jgi:hypothetical protein
VPAPVGDTSYGDLAFQIVFVKSDAGQAIESLVAPFTITYRPTPAELDRAQGDLTRMTLAYWYGDGWTPVPCSPVGSQLACSLSHLSLVRLIIAAPSTGPQDFDVIGGHFFRQANGFSGASDLGYAVLDDSAAQFWTEFQRYGGVANVGYPITNRFVYRGFITQAFQKLVLQWRPELGQAVPLNVLDEFTRPTDSWLAANRQVPSPPAELSVDASQDWDAVVADRQAILDPYTAIRDTYLADDDPLTTYGLPVSVDTYGPLVAVRFQRTTLQWLTDDTPWAPEGTVVRGNAGDLAKEVGLWPPEAAAPIPISAVTQ